MKTLCEKPPCEVVRFRPQSLRRFGLLKDGDNLALDWEVVEGELS